MAFKLQHCAADHQPPQPLAWPAVNEDLLKTLPPVLRGVVIALGFVRAKDFLATHGGVNVSIPRFKSDALGLAPDELKRMRETLACHMDADGRVWLPKADKLFQRVRDTQIRHDRAHQSIASLARTWNLSSRQIVNICRESEGHQLDLF